MKMNLTDQQQQQLVRKLDDEQPGSPLAELRDRLARVGDQSVQLTGSDLTLVLTALMDMDERLITGGNPTGADRDLAAQIASIIGKVERMRERQLARGDQP